MIERSEVVDLQMNDSAYVVSALVKLQQCAETVHWMSLLVSWEVFYRLSIALGCPEARYVVRAIGSAFVHGERIQYMTDWQCGFGCMRRGHEVNDHGIRLEN